MLSIGKIAKGQHEYYERQVARGEDDYYSGRGEAPGEWAGAGARALGLSGRVTAEQFNALIAGRDPRAQTTRLRSAPGDPKVAAFDLTFSAPKSVSILFAIAPVPVSGTLAACHEDAVRAALGYLEDTAVHVRRGKDGERVEQAQGLIAAAYRHRMSRALDPQLHTHVVAANLACGPDGRFTALHSAELYRAAKTAGFLYQAHLRALVSERLGLEWGPVRSGAGELAAVARATIEFFSKRREAMLRAASEGGIGLGSKSAAEHAALATRERKRYGVQTHTWQEETRACAGEQGLGSEEVAQLLKDGAQRTRAGVAGRPEVDEQALGERLAGPAGLTERSNAFDARAVLREFAAAAPQGALANEVRAMAGRFTERPDVIATARGEMTSADLISVERRLIAAVVGRASEHCCVVASELVERVMAACERSLTAEQAGAVRAVVQNGHGVSVIEALAGTGKTYTAGVLREVYEAAGVRVLGVAPTGRAARELTEEAGIPARTLDRLLAELERHGEVLPAGCVVVLDEAGMAGTRASARLLQAAQAAGAKVVAIGDPGQLASVQAGGWMGAVARELGAARLTQVMRQRDPAERRALGALHERLPRPYLQWARRNGRIETFADARDALKRALAQWRADVAEVGPARAVIIARENDVRAALNRAARELRGAQGALGEERGYGDLRLAVGDRVICRHNDRMADVDNGTRGTVRHVDARRVVIDTDGGQVRELPAAYAARHVEHAYALTGHGMQGATVERSLVLASPHDLSAGWSYTALSRARGQTRLLVHDDTLTSRRSEFAPAQRSARDPHAELLARVERRMGERDDEDLAIEQLPAPPSHARLRELGEQIRGLCERQAALPLGELRCIDELDDRASTLATQHERLALRLAALREPTRRLLGSERDHHAAERAQLQSALRAGERDLHETRSERARLEHALGGDPGELRAECEDVQRALAELNRERSELNRAERRLARARADERAPALDLGR